jgi:hypothetical protein
MWVEMARGKRFWKKYSNIYSIMKKTFIIRKIVTVFWLTVIILTCIIDVLGIIYSPDTNLYIILCVVTLIEILFYVYIRRGMFIQDRKIDTDDLQNVDRELTNSLKFKGKSIMIYITDHFLIITRVALIIPIDNIQSLEIKETPKGLLFPV